MLTTKFAVSWQRKNKFASLHNAFQLRPAGFTHLLFPSVSEEAPFHLKQRMVVKAAEIEAGDIPLFSLEINRSWSREAHDNQPWRLRRPCRSVDKNHLPRLEGI